jgi:hypothetical protein
MLKQVEKQDIGATLFLDSATLRALQHGERPWFPIPSGKGGIAFLFHCFQ